MTTLATKPTARVPGLRQPTSPPVGFFLFVPGLPAPQGSKRAIVNHYTGKAAMIESSSRVAPWRADVREAVRKVVAEPTSRPVIVALTFQLPRPKGHYGTGRNAEQLRAGAPRRPTTKPDIDKLARAVLDAMTGIAFVDDSQVVTLNAQKWYDDNLRRVGVVIECRESKV